MYPANSTSIKCTFTGCIYRIYTSNNNNNINNTSDHTTTPRRVKRCVLQEFIVFIHVTPGPRTVVRDRRPRAKKKKIEPFAKKEHNNMIWGRRVINAASSHPRESRGARFSRNAVRTCGCRHEPVRVVFSGVYVNVSCQWRRNVVRAPVRVLPRADANRSDDPADARYRRVAFDRHGASRTTRLFQRFWPHAHANYASPKVSDPTAYQSRPGCEVRIVVIRPTKPCDARA